MSKIEDGILERADVTLATSGEIKDSTDIVNVIVAFKIRNKEFSSAAFKKLIKRYNEHITDEEALKIQDDAKTAYNAIKLQKVAEKKELLKQAGLPDELPNFIEEKIGEDGEPTGEYRLNFMKYTDYLKDKYHVYNLKNTLFCYDETRNVYDNHVNQIQTDLREVCKNFCIDDSLSYNDREVLAHMKSMGCCDKYPFIGTEQTIHVLNGSLNIKTGNLSTSTHENMYDYRIETEYHDFKDKTPELDEFLEIYGVTEPIDVLAKIIWQRAFNDVVKEMTVFVGPKDCGKTTLAELIQVTLDGRIQGGNNTSRTLLHELLQRFGFSDQEGKLMNYGDDLPDMFVKNTSRINNLLGSIIRHIEKKGEDGYDAVCTAYYLFSANNLPPLDDDDDVIWPKIHLVFFNNIINNFRPRAELYTKIIREQLLYRAVQKAVEYSKTPYHNEQTGDWVREKWHEATTDVDAFMRDCTQFEPTATTSLEAIKEHYECWCLLKDKKRHVKQLQKKLKPLFRSTNQRNVYAVKLLEFRPETKNSELPKILVQNSEKAVFPMQAQL